MHPVHIDPTMRRKLSLNRASKYPSFHTDFKNVNLTLVAKKKFCKITNFLGLPAWLKLFLGAIFTKIKCAFLKSKRIDGFLIPFAISEEKSFHLLEGSMNTF